MVVRLEGFPKLPRLKTLLLNNNRIVRVGRHLEGELQPLHPISGALQSSTGLLCSKTPAQLHDRAPLESNSPAVSGHCGQEPNRALDLGGTGTVPGLADPADHHCAGLHSVPPM